MSYLDIINVICFYFAYSTLSPSSTLLLFSLMPFQKEPASWDLPFHPISSTQAQKRLQRKVFTKRVENHWQMFPRGVVDAHPWKCSVIPGSIQDSEEAVLIEYGPAHCGAVGPGGLERSLSTQTCVWFCDLWKPKALRFFCCWQKSSSGTHPEGQQAGLSLKGKVSAVSGFGCSDQAATIKAGFIKTAQKRRALPGPCFGRS